MSYAQNGKDIDRIETMFDRRSFDSMAFAAELICRDEAFRIQFFEVAVNYMQEVASLSPHEVHDPMMVIYRDIAKNIVAAL